MATDTTAEAAEVQLRVYQSMRPEDRLRAALELTAMSRHLLTDGIRARHPEYSEEEVHLAVIRAWLSPEVYREAYRGFPEVDP